MVRNPTHPQILPNVKEHEACLKQGTLALMNNEFSERTSETLCKESFESRTVHVPFINVEKEMRAHPTHTALVLQDNPYSTSCYYEFLNHLKYPTSYSFNIQIPQKQIKHHKSSQV